MHMPIGVLLVLVPVKPGNNASVSQSQSFLLRWLAVSLMLEVVLNSPLVDFMHVLST